MNRYGSNKRESLLLPNENSRVAPKHRVKMLELLANNEISQMIFINTEADCSVQIEIGPRTMFQINLKSWI